MSTRVSVAGGAVAVAVAVIALGGGNASAGESPGEELRAVESAFAATMAERDLEAFSTFLDDEVVFFTGPEELRGRLAVAEAWARFDLAPRF